MKNSKLAALAVAATLAVAGTAVTVGSATAASGQDTTCTPQAAVLSAWTSAGKLPVQHDDNTPPVDPDGTDEASTTNLVKFEGPVTTKHVTKEATQGGHTPWVNSGEPIRTEENVAPGEDTETVQYLFVEETDPEVVGTEVTGWQNWTWHPGKNWEEPADGLGPYWPDTTKPGHWSPNNGNHNGHPQPGTDGVNSRGNYFMSRGSSGIGDWFHWEASTEPVMDTDFIWQKQVREVVPAGQEESHTDYQWEKFTRTFTPAVECPETPTETPTVPTETPTVPTETPTVPTETPEVPDETTPVTPEETPTPEDTPEDTPESTPQPPKDKQVIECVDGVFVTTVNGEVISESGSCVERDENETPVTFSETGL